MTPERSRHDQQTSSTAWTIAMLLLLAVIAVGLVTCGSHRLDQNSQHSEVIGP